MLLQSVAFAPALCASVAWATTYDFQALKPRVTHGDYAYRFVGPARARDFILAATLKTSSAGPAARVLFAYHDERNYYYAEASDQGCLFVKVEDGIGKRIGTPSEGQLARDAGARLTVIRWRPRMALWVNGRRVAEAYDGAFRQGRVGVAGRAESVTIDKVRFQAVGDIRLSDDFMRTAAEESPWETVSGAWELRSLPSASLSANAFMFAGSAAEEGKAALTVRGEWFWHGYGVSMACRPLDDKPVGLVFYYRSPTDYHLVRWGPGGPGGRLQLIRVAGGKQEVLGQAPVGFTKGQWYQLEARVCGRRVIASVDGNPLIRVSDPRLVSGAIGLYCEGADGALFDDVAVAASRSFGEDFERACAGKWLELGGEWRQQRARLDGKEGEGGCLIGSAPGEARYVAGEESWQDYTIAADLLPPVRGDVGLVACYQDEANYYLFSLSPTEAKLSRVLEGKRADLAAQPCQASLGVVHRIEFSVRRGVLTGWLDGKLLVRRCDRTLERGRAGLYVQGNAGAGFGNVAATFAERSLPLFTAHDVFSAEASMENWAVRQSDWLPGQEPLGGAQVSWHRADFPDDVEIQAKIKELASGGRLWLILAGDAGAATNAYTACLERQKEGCRVTLGRRGKQVAERKLTPKQPPELFGAERVGHAIIAHLDGQVALTHDDPDPLPGRRIGWAAAGAEVARNGVEIFSPSVTVYAFHRAPVDWRAAAGEWQVTNRWACDPRWSFFAGQQRDDKLVALWNKRDFGPDTTLEFAAGIRHNPDRGGTAYAYASDINAVICGDGADLRNGYSFIFGGWNNQHTRILRNGKAVAETDAVRFPRDGSQHRQWFYFKVQNQGGRLRFYVDNQLALEYNDPEPLAGRKVAIWTWNNDIMVARVRVSASGTAPCEVPAGPPPERPQCCYR